MAQERKILRQAGKILTEEREILKKAGKILFQAGKIQALPGIGRKILAQA